MLFNSLSFAIFFPVVTAGYFLLPFRYRWAWLLAASCVFYMYFIPAYILVLAFTIIVDYAAGLFIERSEGRRRTLWLIASLAANLGVLAVFKYADFASRNLAGLAKILDWNYSVRALGLILPIGLSFHTFQAMSYTIEVYRRRQSAERHFGIYALYVMFYPQLVAGPIERPQNLIPQLRRPHRFAYARVADGLGLMAWGFFKKLVVADRLAAFVNPIYDDPTRHAGPALSLATICFAFQIYSDFSGYSDIAVGAARVMGIDLTQNFRAPYLSRSVVEFWHRWHISLSSWFRDYVYIPLGGNRVSLPRHVANTLIVFAASGLWHGANWTFVVWGLIHGVFVTAATVTRRLRERFGNLFAGRLATLRKAAQIVVTFAVVDSAWIFFRAANLSDAWYIVTHLHQGWRWTMPVATAAVRPDPLHLAPAANMWIAAVMVSVMLISELADQDRALWGIVAERRWWVRWPAYYALVSAILVFGVFERSSFIYFQF